MDAPGSSFVERDSVRVVFWGGTRSAADLILDAALAPLPTPGIPGTVILSRSTIFLASTPARFDSLTAGRAPDWAAGVAIPSTGVIILPTYRRNRGFDDPIVTLRHEVAHLALNDYIDGLVPRWFDEGYATWVSGGWDANSGWIIRLAFLRGSAPPLDSLSLGWPSDENQARLAYLLSASAVQHLATSRTPEAFDSLMAVWRREGNLDIALRSVYQMTVPQFEREWRAMVRRRYGWLLAISLVGVFWVVIVLLVLLLGSARRRRNRERLEALRREEYMLPATTGDGIDSDYDEE
jgi:hypothetical protein